MIVQREMLSWLTQLFPHPDEVVLEENPTANWTVLLIWFHQLCPLMLLSHKAGLICTFLEQTLCCSIQRLRQILLRLLARLRFLREKLLTIKISPMYDVHVLNTTKFQVFSCSAKICLPLFNPACIYDRSAA